MKTTNKSTVELLDHMGSDLSIVNAARVSFDKESNWEDCQGYCLNERDKKLIKYLAKHNHWSPFAHTSIQLRVTAPIFVARQLEKHQVGGVWNEVSRRYVDDEPVFYFPDKWRRRAENVKQGSSGEEYDGGFAWQQGLYKKFTDLVDTYNAMIKNGCAPEQARMILPQNMMTSWIWTGSLMFFHRVYKQRSDEHAQKETQEVAHEIGHICSKLFPVSWSALNARIEENKDTTHV
jgi:thymidylate synthase (FAD)